MAKKKAAKKAPTKAPEKSPAFPPEGKTYQFETLLELVHLLQHVNNECARAGQWKYRIFIFPCTLDDERFYLGCQFGRVYITRSREAKGIYRPVAREVLKTYYARVPTLVLKDHFWAHDFVRDDPPGGKTITVTDPAVFQEVAEVVEHYIADLGPERAARRRLRDAGAPPWEACSICNPIPESIHGFWKGGELESGGIPATEQYLYVVGEPIFNDSDSYRHWCLKQCPECGTCYLWQFDYEFLAGGSEDEVEVKRLNDQEAEEWQQKVREVIRASTERFEAAIPGHLETLTTRKRRSALKEPVDFFYHEQLVNGHDLTPAVPALVHALAHHQHVQKKRIVPGIGSAPRSWTTRASPVPITSACSTPCRRRGMRSRRRARNSRPC